VLKSNRKKRSNGHGIDHEFGQPAAGHVVFAVNGTARIARYQRGVVFHARRFTAVKGPGLIVLIPGVQQMVRIDLRTWCWTAGQDVISHDNVSVKVNAWYFRVVDPQRAVIQVENSWRRPASSRKRRCARARQARPG